MVDGELLKQSGADFLSVLIDRADVERLDIQPTLNTLEQLLHDRETVARFRGRLDIGFAGYDDDSRELYEIAEVRRFLAALDHKFPFWFYFLNLRSGTLVLVFFCFCRSFKRSDGLFEIDSDDQEKFIVEHGAAVQSLINRYALPEEVNETVAGQIAMYLHERAKLPRIQ